MQFTRKNRKQLDSVMFTLFTSKHSKARKQRAYYRMKKKGVKRLNSKFTW